MLPRWALLGEGAMNLPVLGAVGSSAPTGMSVWYKIALA